MPWWWNTAVGLIRHIIDGWFASRQRASENVRADQALKDMGAATQQAESLREAEREEDIARRAGEVAAVAIDDDPRDLRD